MIKYTKEKFQKLKAEYLKHIENTKNNPAGYIAEQMRRFGPIDRYTEEYIMLMLIDDADRDTLSELLIYLHYADAGRNILVETPNGYVGENSECRARSFNDSIRQRADHFNEYRRQLEKKRTRSSVRKSTNRTTRPPLSEKLSRRLKTKSRTLENRLPRKSAR